MMVGGFSEVTDLGEPGGTPMMLWTSSFRLTYSLTRFGVLFNEWPDGKSAEEQEQVIVEVFDIMKDEALAIINETRSE